MALIDSVSIKPSPDFSRFRKVLLRQGIPDRIPFYELFADKPIKDLILGKPCPIALIPFPDLDQLLRNEIEYWRRLGFDYVPASPPFLFTAKASIGKDTASLTLGVRFWLNEAATNIIHTRADYDQHFFPTVDMINWTAFDRLCELLPQDMVVFGQISGVLENVMWLMGHEGLAFALADDPELVQMMFDRIGSAFLQVTQLMLERPRVGAIQMGDDLGFSTGPFISPPALRRYVFPWQKKMVEATHAAGRPFILHSCGNLEKIMDDLIDEVGIDAKHSFEDKIMPVAEVKRRWGKRIAVLGGVDVDVLARASVEETRTYTRRVIRDCKEGGGWALGSGNSVANYIKPENYLAMLDVGWKF